MVNTIIAMTTLGIAFAARAETTPAASRMPANVGRTEKLVTCNVRLPGDNTEKTLHAKMIDYVRGPSLQETFGDYQAAAYFDSKNDVLTIGVTDVPNGSMTSTTAKSPGQVAHLFASKPNKSIELQCYY